ncbi:MAG TPA: SDR family NAD(P)-dependent oxidoreductase [Rhizobiaceae bacterium]|nr:SDR family NAD(P)-dependent oxidoreductase [Rhizobiaceae bacterium]
MTARIEGKVVVVMGAGSVGPGWGNGKACAVLYAREGAHVVAVDLNEDAVYETQSIIEGEGGSCMPLVADISKSGDLQRVFNDTQKRFGRIDVLHNNVGIMMAGGIDEMSEDDWDKIVRVNMTGIFLSCKYALPILAAQRAGSIVNIGSIASLQWMGLPYIGYTTTKAAVVTITKNIARQYAPSGIRANCVLPGLMHTPMIQVLTAAYGDEQAMIEKRNAQVPMGKMGTAWDVAYASLFLASDEAQYITGQELVVDGGVTL